MSGKKIYHKIFIIAIYLILMLLAIFLLGSGIFEDIDRQLRWRACHPKTNVQSDGPSDRAQGLVFFSVSDSKKAADCLQQQMGRAA